MKTSPVDSAASNGFRPPGFRRRACLLSFALLVLAALAWRSTNFASCLLPEPESCAAASVGQQVANGRILYAGAWDTQQPGIYLINAAAIWLGNDHLNSVRQVERLFMVANVILFFFVCMLLGRRVSLSLAISLVYLLLFTQADMFQGGNVAEEYGVVFMLGGILFALLALRAKGTAALVPAAACSGACLALSVCMKGQFLLSAAPWFIVLGGTMKKKKGAYAGGVAGAAFVWLAVVAYLASTGGLGAWLDAMWFSNGHAAVASIVQTDIPGVVAAGFARARELLVGRSHCVLVLFIVGVLALCTRPLARGGRRVNVAIVAWVVLSFVGVAFGECREKHCYLQLVPAVAAVALAGIVYLSNLSSQRSIGAMCVVSLVAWTVIVIAPRWVTGGWSGWYGVPAWQKVALVAALCMVVGVGMFEEYKLWLVGPLVGFAALMLLADVRPLCSFAARLTQAHGRFDVCDPIAERLRACSQADEGLFAPDTCYGLVVGRMSPSRYAGGMPVFSDTRLGSTEAKKRAFVAEIEQQPPRFMVLPSPLFFHAVATTEGQQWFFSNYIIEFGTNMYGGTNMAGLYRFRTDSERGAAATQAWNLVRNGKFDRRLDSWTCRPEGAQQCTAIHVVAACVPGGGATALRMDGAIGGQPGVQQAVPVVSGHVYRLSAWARCAASNASASFGGRLSLLVPEQQEKVLDWPGQRLPVSAGQSPAELAPTLFSPSDLCTTWVCRSVVFTNSATGTGSLSIVMRGDGGASIGDVADVRLEYAYLVPVNPYGTMEAVSNLVRNGSFRQIWRRGEGGSDLRSRIPTPAEQSQSGEPIGGCPTLAPTFWTPRGEATGVANTVVYMGGLARLINPAGGSVGIQQTMTVMSGGVYRLSGKARPIGVCGTTEMFGRVSCFVPSQHEVALFWRNSGKDWIEQSVVFTNQTTCMATLYADTGFRGLACTSEFTGIALEKMESPAKPVVARAAAVDAETEEAAPMGPSANDVVMNGDFALGLMGWEYWHTARERTNAIRTVAAAHPRHAHAVRIENGDATLIGIKQTVTVVSGGVYRLCGAARSAGKGTQQGMLGGRIAIYPPRQPERELVWLGQHTNWWRRSLVFTNLCDGPALVVVHLGYGNAVSTGEFTDVGLERLAERSGMLDSGSLMVEKQTGEGTGAGGKLQVAGNTLQVGRGNGREGNDQISNDKSQMSNDIPAGMRMAETHPSGGNVRQYVGASVRQWGNEETHPSVPSREGMGERGTGGAPVVDAATNLLDNGSFTRLWAGWTPRDDAAGIDGSVVYARGQVRLMNPAGKMVGIEQGVALTSGAVYKLTGSVRSLCTNDLEAAFGARVGCFIHYQPVQALVWKSEYNEWWSKSIVFTNRVTGMATVYLDMGSGGVGSTGEFTDVRLEMITDVKRAMAPEAVFRMQPCGAANLLRNGSFTNAGAAWEPRKDAATIDGSVVYTGGVVRLLNPADKMVGIQQTVAMQSGEVYRLAGTVRSLCTNDANVGFGARVAWFMRGQKEHALDWTSEHNSWSEKSVVFTNEATGAATVYLHMGYGGIGSTGEFKDIRFELVGAEGRPQPALTVVRYGESGGVQVYSSVWQAIREADRGDCIVISNGTYREEMCYVNHPLNPALEDVSIVGCGTPVIVVVVSNVPSVNECGVDLSCARGLRISNVAFRTVCEGNNLPNVYNAVFSGCTDIVVDACVFQSEVEGTGNTFKTLVATAGATNVLVRDCKIITVDLTGGNGLYHTATHDADATVFEHVVFIGKNVKRLDVGEVVLKLCAANSVLPRYGTQMEPALDEVVRGAFVGERADMLAKVVSSFSPAQDVAARDIVRNGVFGARLAPWMYWPEGNRFGGMVESVAERGPGGAGTALRIGDHGGGLHGVQQMVVVVSNRVYRLSAYARSDGKPERAAVFGGRVSLWIPPQREIQLVWPVMGMDWQRRAAVFTNDVTGTGIVYVRMGYGSGGGTGEFTGVRLEWVAGDR